MKYSQGRVHGVSPVTFLQMVEQDQTTCTVSVRKNDQRGSLYFQKGVLMDAETRDLSGTDAAYAIINWRDPELEIVYDGNPHPRRIERPLMAIILDVYKMVDEAGRASGRAEGTARDPEDGQTSSATHDLEDMEMNTLPALLDDFKEEVPEFVSTDIVSVDSGLSISGSSADPDFDASVASACSAEVVKANRRTLELLGLGAHSTEDILISSAKVYLLIRMLGPEYYHVLAVNRKGNLGLARAIMKKHQPRLLRAISDLE